MRSVVCPWCTTEVVLAATANRRVLLLDGGPLAGDDGDVWFDRRFAVAHLQELLPALDGVPTYLFHSYTCTGFDDWPALDRFGRFIRIPVSLR